MVIFALLIHCLVLDFPLMFGGFLGHSHNTAGEGRIDLPEGFKRLWRRGGTLPTLLD
jgi:hypothetical protein